MTKRASAVMAAALVLFATAANAQSPDLSGKWLPDAEKNAAANPGAEAGGGGRPGGGGRAVMAPGPMSIKADAGTLTIERETPMGTQTVTYKLDGSEQTVTMGQNEAKVKAHCEGATVIIETTREFNGNTLTTKAVYAIEGEHLVVATTSPGRGGSEPMTRKVYYKKG